MQVKRYKASNMQKALKKIKDELGDNAVIFSSRSITPQNNAGRSGSRSWVEVTAAIDRNPEGTLKQGYVAEPVKPEALSDLLQNEIRRIEKKIDTIGPQIERWLGFQSLLNRGRTQIPTQRSQAGRTSAGEHADQSPACAATAPALVKKLLSIGFDENLAWDLIEIVKKEDPHQRDSANIEEILIQQIANRIPVGGPLAVEAKKTKAVALIGTTGVGKTTTLAKLAAHYAVEKRMNVKILTCDTYRIAAVEQLKIYGRLMGVPVVAVSTPKGLKQELQRQNGTDLILIDTAGRNYNNYAQINELTQFLQQGQELESHLLLSAATTEEGIQATIAGFSRVGLDRIIITKVDESPSFGHLYNSIISMNIPLSYMTIGQRVPEDIRPVSAMGFSRIIWNGFSNENSTCLEN